MCNFEQGFKLCTCDKQQLKKSIEHKAKISFWKLKRFESHDWTEMEIGRCFYPHHTATENEIAEFILYYLNTEHCFDFDFIPKPKDTLNFILFSQDTDSQALKDIQPLKFEFIFDDNKWQQVDEISEHLNENWVIYQGQISTKKF